MFESDDFDECLNQVEFPYENDKSTSISKHMQNQNSHQIIVREDTKLTSINDNKEKSKHMCQSSQSNCELKSASPKHMKRKIINSFFNYNKKRKFPGPAGLLSGNLEETKDENICEMELLSQDVNYTQNCLRPDLFETPLWNRVFEDLNKWNISGLDSIKEIKNQALASNLRQIKAHIVAAFIESVDRSVMDPLIILRDITGTINCTLHRDAWTIFSPYIVSENCVLLLWKPTVLTTGNAFKRHYLNITLSNIFAIYSSAMIKDEEDCKPLPESFLKENEENLTIIKTDFSLCTANLTPDNGNKEDLFDDLDNIFKDDML